MGLKWRRLSWPWCNGDFVFGGSGGGDGRKRPPKTVNIFMGYFFMVNICLGVGFLGIPYSFFYSGYLAAIPSLILIGLVSWLNSVWLLEVMARAQVRYRCVLCSMNSLLAKIHEPAFEFSEHIKFVIT